MLIYECDSCGKKIRDKRLVHRVDYLSPVSNELDERGDEGVYLSEGFHTMQVVGSDGKVLEEIDDRRFYLCPECAEGFMRYVHLDTNKELTFRSFAPNK